jgi:cullin 1
LSLGAFIARDTFGRLSKVEFSVQVLTTGHWPNFKTVDITLPPVMQRCVAVFADHYSSKTSHKRLQWTYSLGNVSLRGLFGKKSYEIQVIDSYSSCYKWKDFYAV